ncbi:MAG: hypothetical protein C5B50_01140 [Verrucomicrobia bacterium]|nr:MAG: hypothetical protein C5B50_01140 [Verrucomicrobiota bacterium]
MKYPKQRRAVNSPAAPISVAVFILAVLFAPASLMAQNAVTGGGINFADLGGTNNTRYTGSVEGDFNVTANTTNWFRDITVYGDPPPSIYDGPTNSPGTAILTISDSKGHFTFSSFEYSSNNGQSTYDIQGFLGSVLEYEETGTLIASFPPNFGFNSQGIANSTVEIDGLQITVIPGSGVTSINLDNIGVATIPEPGSLGLLGAGVGVMMALGRGRRR